MAIVEWLAAVGERWGLPADACRVHGLLYLVARPLRSSEICDELCLSSEVAASALSWLVEEELVGRGSEGWATQSDPWLLMLQTLEKRRQRELAPALSVLEPWRRADVTENLIVARQAKRLLDLVEDVAAIEAGTARFSPRTLRRIIGIGGRAARLFGGAGREREKR